MGVPYVYMHVITQHDFETKAGQQKIILAIHRLESRVLELEKTVHTLAKENDMLEHDLQGPEAY